MSSGDRGGMVELYQLIKKTEIPIICICNDKSSPKMKTLKNYCLDLEFRKPTTTQVLPRVLSVAQAEVSHFFFIFLLLPPFRFVFLNNFNRGSRFLRNPLRC